MVSSALHANKRLLSKYIYMGGEEGLFTRWRRGNLLTRCNEVGKIQGVMRNAVRNDGGVLMRDAIGRQKS